MAITSRREFCAITVAGAAASLRSGTLRPAAELRVGVVAGAATTRSSRVQHALDGLALGAAEAARTATLFGARVQFVHAEMGGPAPASAVARRLAAAGADVLCLAVDGADARLVHAVAAELQRPCIDLLSPAPAAPGLEAPGPGEAQRLPQAPRPWVAYVVPSPPASADAVLRALAGELRPLWETRRTALLAASPRAADLLRAANASPGKQEMRSVLSGLPHASGPEALDGLDIAVLAALDREEAAAMLALTNAAHAHVVVVDLFGVTTGLPRYTLPQRLVRAETWLPDLFRYGAAQLNDRFRARYGTAAAMDSAAWGGWFAAKAVVEAALRSPSGDPPALRDRLFTLRFDGHKGMPLAFSGDGELIQPLYVPSGTGGRKT